MTQLLALRKEVSKKLRGISLRQLRNRVRDVSSNEVIPDRTLALLLIATRDAKIDIKQPRFKVPPEKITALEEFLAKGRATFAVSPSPSQKKVSKEQFVKYRRLLKFTGSYPLPVFYDRLEAEINTAYSNPDLPNAVLVLSRKLVENLVYNLLAFRFKGPGIDLYYDTSHRRAHDFSVILDNLQKHKTEFEIDLQDDIDRFLKIMTETNFRREINSKTHTVMEYLGSMKEVWRLKIPDMVQILLLLIERVKEPEPKYLNVTKAEALDNGLLISVMNAGSGPERLTDYAIDHLPKKPFGAEVVIKEGDTAKIVLVTHDGYKFQRGKPAHFRLWLYSGKEISFQHTLRIPRPRKIAVH